MHPAITVGDDKKLLFEAVVFYNASKWGVDIVDQMAKNYTVNAASQRWLVKYFFNILNLAAINAYILYKKLTGARITRRRFLLQLVEELCCKYVQAPRVKHQTKVTLCLDV